VWLKLKIRLQQRVEVLNIADELSAAIKDIWENLSVDYIQGLYHSIPKRLRKVLKVKGENSPALENVSQSQAISCPREFQCIYVYLSCHSLS
jgi:hypothetical protein